MPAPALEESDSRRRVREMTEAGHAPREIAKELGISPQRVHQHLKRLRKTGALPLYASESAERAS